MINQVVWGKGYRGMKQLQKRYEESAKEVVVQKRDVYHFRFCFIPLLSLIHTSLVFVLYLSSICFIPLPLSGAPIHPNAGKTGVAFLKIGGGSRPVAMGESYAALGRDLQAVYWNPAGLIGLRTFEVSAAHSEWFQGIRHNTFILGFPLESSRHVLAVSGTMLYLGGLERRTGVGELPDEDPTVSMGSFGSTDLSGMVSYALGLGEGWSVGLNAKVISSSIDTYSALAFAADAGVQGRLAEGLWLGMSVQHVGSPIKFVSESFGLPLNFKVGVGYQDTSIRLGVDLNQPVDDFYSVGLGLEYGALSFLDLRAGFRSRLVGEDLGGMTGFTAGFGMRWDALSFDYAFVPYGELGLTHRVSLGVRFGEPHALPSPAKAEAGTAPAPAVAPEDPAGMAQRLEKEIQHETETLNRRGSTLSPEDKKLAERRITQKQQRLKQLKSPLEPQKPSDQK